MRKCWLLFCLVLFVGCGSPNLYQKETADMIAKIIEANGNSQIVRIQAKQENEKEPAIINNIEKENPQFDKLFEIFIDFDGLKEWWKIANFNCPNVKYTIFIINGSTVTEYDGGQVPININNNK